MGTEIVKLKEIIKRQARDFERLQFQLIAERKFKIQ